MPLPVCVRTAPLLASDSRMSPEPVRAVDIAPARPRASMLPEPVRASRSPAMSLIVMSPEPVCTFTEPDASVIPTLPEPVLRSTVDTPLSERSPEPSSPLIATPLGATIS
ncbi:hypothetical protein Psuf_017170 [Phytohabitans suffuscus]|uniref:Uncharacterized protein n=1 Tax=Phytohabitans suffuscus TaxID=624315 RepID=A0A6F8YE39_9ACTN|nr:hypothetical protein Psuf_017170 [Phytohabitans suffuscus]